MSATSAFRLPANLSAKADPALIGDDELHFAAIEATLAQTLADLSARRDEVRRHAGGAGEQALERDLEIHRLTARLRALGRYRLDLCLGRIVRDDGEIVYIGRFGLTDDDGARLLVDWRAPAAEPYFAATHADPRGLVSRRRYRWSGGAVTDYWDEAFTEAGLASSRAALDDQSAFIASLGASRSPQMRDVLSTIQGDQDAAIRADSRGALVVDGGPGTGKTVVALHRAAYLLYADPRLAPGRGGVLVVGPHQPYLAYVGDVLPSLGEEGVQTCTLRELTPEGPGAALESDPRAAVLKASARLLAAIEPAVRLYEEPPTTTLVVETPWAEVELTAADWADAFAAADPGVSHNDAREQVWDELIGIVAERHDGDIPIGPLRRAIARDEEFARTFGRAWPLLDATTVVADLWAVPAYLRRCAPDLSPDEVALLRRERSSGWTIADLPLLDAARARIGDAGAVRQRVRREAVRAVERERRAAVIDDLIAADDSELHLMSMLRGEDAQNTLDDDAVLPTTDPDLLAGPFAHVIVDEAQELSDAEWGMLLRRCPSRSFTIVGDRAQARHGFAESWEERLARVGFGSIRIASLGVNYRTPREVMAEAEPVIRAAIPDANVPTAVRESGLPVIHGDTGDLDRVVDEWLAAHPEGTACVIGAPAYAERPRVRSLSPELSKGLEFDLVVVVDPDDFGGGIEGAVDRYVAMTRTTAQLVILRDGRVGV